MPSGAVPPRTVGPEEEGGGTLPPPPPVTPPACLPVTPLPVPPATPAPDAPTVGPEAPASEAPAVAPEGLVAEHTLAVGAPLPGGGFATPRELLPGAVLGGYEIGTLVGRGGMGLVFKARHRRLGKAVAIKVIVPGPGGVHPGLVARFHQEAKLAAGLQHGHIVPIFDQGEERGLHYFVMDFVEGETLASLLRRGEIDIRAALEAAREAALGLDYAHARGVVHRDVKPENIMVDSEGQARVMDFGLAKSLAATVRLTQAGAVIGTPQYMAPECVDKKLGEVGPAADIYGIGGVLYFILTGRPPYQGTSTQDVILKIGSEEIVPPSRAVPDRRPDEALEAICMKALQRDPRRRYLSAGALAEDLRRFLEGEPVLARMETTLGAIAERTPFRRVLLGLAGSVLLLGLLAAAFGFAVDYVTETALRGLEEQVVADARSEARTVAEAIRTGMMQDHVDFLRDYAALLRENREAGEMDVLRPDGRTAFDDETTWQTVIARLSAAAPRDLEAARRLGILRATEPKGLYSPSRRGDVPERNWRIVLTGRGSSYETAGPPGDGRIVVVEPIPTGKQCVACHGEPGPGEAGVLGAVLIRKPTSELTRRAGVGASYLKLLGAATAGAAAAIVLVFVVASGSDRKRRRL